MSFQSSIALLHHGSHATQGHGGIQAQAAFMVSTMSGAIVLQQPGSVMISMSCVHQGHMIPALWATTCHRAEDVLWLGPL